MKHCTKRILAWVLAVSLLISCGISGLVLPISAEVGDVKFTENFEGDTTSAVIKNFTNSGEVVTDPTDPNNKVLKITTALSNTYSGGKFGLQADKTYLYRFRAYGANNVTAIFNPGKGILNAASKKMDTTGAWKEFVYIVKTTSQYNNFNNDAYCIGMTAPVGTYIDDFSLVEIEHDAKNLLVGGDFEADEDYYPMGAWQQLMKLGEVTTDPDDANNHVLHLNQYGTGNEFYVTRTGIQANKAYTLSFRAKGKNLRIYLTGSKGVATKAGWNTVLDNTGSDEWIDYKLTFTTAGTVSDDGHVINFGAKAANLQGAPDAYIDDVRLELASATAITMPEEKLYLGAGATEQLTLTYEPVGSVVDSVAWTSADETIATVDATGKVTAQNKSGETTITATASVGGQTLTATRTVVVVKKADSFAFAADALSVPIGGKVTAEIVADPEGSDVGNLTFTSSDETVATVDENGVITGVAAGTATITVTTADNAVFAETVSDTLTVTVEAVKFFEDFEGETTSKVIKNWVTNSDLVADPTNPNNKVLKTKTAMSNQYSGGSFGLEVNKTYVYSFRAYGTTNVQAKFNTGKGILNDGRKMVDTTAGWTQFVYIVKTTDIYGNFANDGFCIGITAPVGTYLDDFMLVEAENDAKNFLVGGDFEADPAYYPIAAWYQVMKLGQVEVDADDANNHVLHITEYGNGSNYYHSRVGLRPNKAYTLSLRAKGKNLKIYLALSSKGITSNSGWHEVLSAEGSDDWIEYKLTFTTGATVDDNGYIFNFGGQTQHLAGAPDAYIDDVRLELASATAITLPEDTLYLGAGASEQLAYTCEPAGSVVDSVVWTSSDETIATVDANGKVTALDKGGEAIITVTATVGGQEISATRKVVVVKKAESFAFAEDAITLPLGGKKTASVVADPVGADIGNLTFTSSDETVATVDANGVVTAVAAGTATITVKNADNVIFAGTITDTLTVKVEPMIFFEDFEGAETASAIKSWVNKGEVVVDPTNPNNKVLKVTTALSTQYTGKFTYEVNKTYLFRFRAYGGNKVQAHFNGSKGILNNGAKKVDTTAGWTEFVYIMKTTDMYNNFLLDNYGIALTAPVGTYLDDFTIEEVAHDAKNLLVGGDFETDAAYYPIGAWYQVAKIGEVVADPDDANNHVLHINQFGTGNEYYNGRVGIQGNKSYTLSFRAKGKNLKIYLALSGKGVISNNGWKTVLDDTGSDTWVNYTLTFSTAASVDDAGYILSFGGKSDNLAGEPDAYIDDVRLERATAEEIAVDPTTLYMGQGMTDVLDFTTTPVGAVYDSVVYTSADTSLVTIDSEGVITSTTTKEGETTVTVTVTVGGKTLTATRTVAVVGDADSFNFEKEDLHLAPGTKAQAVVVAVPNGARVGNLVFSSNNTAVATVDANGIITAVSSGTATITVKNADNAVFAGTVEDTIVVNVDDFGERINGGSFQDAACNDAQWTTSIIKDGVGEVVRDSADRDNLVLKLVPKKQTVAVYGVKLNPNKSYKLTFKARGSSMNTVIAEADTTAGNRGTVSTSLKTTEWTEITRYFNTGANPSDTLLSIANGSTTVALEIDDVSLVQLPDATGLKANLDSSVSMVPGNKETLSVTAEPEGAFAGDVVYSSSDSSVVAIDEKGNLVVVGEEGTAILTATSKNQAGETMTATVTVTADNYANFFNNGDFEQGTKYWGLNGKNANLNELIVEGVGKDGTAGLLLKNESEAAVEVFYKSALNLLPGTTYKISFEYKTYKSTAEYPVRLWSGTVGFGQVRAGNSKGEWKSVSKVFTTSTKMKLNTGWDVGIVVDPGPADGMVFDNIKLELYDSGVPATSIEMNKKSIRLVPGRSTTLAVMATPLEGDVNLLKWTSSNENVATVEYGIVTGVGKGEATITAETRNGKKATATVIVSGSEAIVKNGTFDIANDTSWTMGGSAAISATEGVRKTAGAKLVAAGDKVSQTLKGLKPDTAYTLSLRYSGTGNADILLKNGDKQLVKASEKAATAWATKTYTFTTASEVTAESILEIALASGTGPIYLDYVMLTENATLIDLVVNDIYWISPAGPLEQDHQVKPGTELQFVVTVLNQGEDPVKAGMTFDVEVQVDAQTVQTITYTATDDIATGDIAIIISEDLWKATEGDHTISACANATLTILELDDSNNDHYQSSLRVAEEFHEIPEMAELAGYDELIFNDDFSSLHTIDTFGTGAAGYKWYVTRPYANTKLDPDDYEIKDGVLTVKNKDSQFNYGMASIDENTGRGFVFNKGFLEFRLRIPSYDADKKGGPAVWSFPPDKIVETSSTYAIQWVEMDWMEYWGITKERPEGHWTISMHEQIRETTETGIGNPDVMLAHHSAANRHKRGLGDAEWHDITFLWTDNLLVSWLDGVEVFRITYAEGEYSNPYTFNNATEDGTGAFSYMNEQLLALILGGSVDNQMELDYIRVWGGSGSGYVPPSDGDNEEEVVDMDAETFWFNYCVDDFGDPIVPETLDEYSSLYILQGAEIWNKLSDARKAEINELLASYGQPTFDELIAAVVDLMAEDNYVLAFLFVELYLIGSDGLPIYEVTEENYKQILESAEVFMLLDKETQLEVIALMNDYGMPTFDVLVAEALALAEELGDTTVVDPEFEMPEPGEELPDGDEDVPEGEEDDPESDESPETGVQLPMWPIVVMIACAAVLLLSHKRKVLA